VRKKTTNQMNTTFPEQTIRPKDIEMEVTTLQNHYSEIIKKVGKFVLIHGKSIVDYFDSYRAAHNAGYARFGLGDFLVRPVKNPDQPISVMRFGVVRMGHELHISRKKSPRGH
jgi:hypothetical protein